jgi:selT/selW/selH-like putative selenoprotein
MQRNFREVAKFLEEKFPDLRGRIYGQHYPTPPLVELLQRILSYIQLIGVAWMILGGQVLFRMLGYQQEMPQFYWTIQNNGVHIATVVFFILPQILNSFAVNGAFEIYLNDEEIFSKLKQGGFPRQADLLDPLQAAGLKMAS